jgi:hypothetical protein
MARDHMFFRTGWVMRAASPEKGTGEAELESSLAVDAQARGPVAASSIIALLRARGFCKLEVIYR